jgi:EAL domain-containing protein (putative c-di-GMP-specific phosphodiesterase class I)
MSVNISAKCLKQFDLAEEVRVVLQQNRLEGRRLKLEITESGLMDNSLEILSMLDRLREMQVDIHIDDFGTGYSSLAYLHQFQVQALKIDRFFISNLDAKEHMPGFIRTVMHLAHDLGLQVIAEGVENQGQLAQLQGLDCEYGQGYLLSEPLAEEEATGMLSKIQAGGSFFPVLQPDLQEISASGIEGD